eukprot:3277712-Amphidinium_carterae.1
MAHFGRGIPNIAGAVNMRLMLEPQDPRDDHCRRRDKSCTDRSEDARSHVWEVGLTSPPLCHYRRYAMPLAGFA